MLASLKVLNLAVVERAEIEFCPELNVVTGETGAGKSVLMGALGLVLGGRAEASIVRDGAKESEVEAVFSTKSGETRIRRTVTRDGRSRAWIDDESVTMAELKEKAANLVDIHGPTANQQLGEEHFQRETLDEYGAVELVEYRRHYAEYSELVAERGRLAAMGSADEDALDLLRYQVDELKAAELTEEDETLAERHAAAAHAEEIVANANVITEGLGGDQSVAEILIALQPKFREIAKHLPEATEWAERAEAITMDIQELSREVAQAISKMDLGAEDLKSLDDRLTVVNRLKRKYRVEDVPALLKTLMTKAAKLEELEHREERLAELDGKIAAVKSQVIAVGGKVSEKRRKAAIKLAKEITVELKELGFKSAKFSIAVEKGEIESHGLDHVTYFFEPNPGEVSRPLAEIASSGETARVMLALKTIIGGTSTMVFDEIDANIGGETGTIVGEKLAKAAKRQQVIAITHLPQSAVFGRRHLVVRKTVDAGRTHTTVEEVKGEARVDEIARMLGGEQLTSVTRKHAKEMLKLGEE